MKIQRMKKTKKITRYKVNKDYTLSKIEEEEKPVEPPKAPEPTKEEVLLTEIRDLLKAQQDKE